MKRLTSSLLAALALVSGAAQATTACADKIDTSSPILSNGFGFNGSNTRNQTSEINANNVATLTVAYTQVASDAKEKRGAPAVTQQTVYFSEGRDIVAANRATGCEYWRFTGLDLRNPFVGGGTNPIRSSIYYLPATTTQPAMVYGGDQFAHVYALNAATGKQVWERFMGTDPVHHGISGSPQIHNGTLFMPISTNEVFLTTLEFWKPCCSSHGMLQAVDAYTGKIKWTYHTTPPARFNFWTWFKGPNGVSLWGTPMIDAANNAVVVGSGQNFSHPTTNNSDALISLDLDTGKVKWIFQTTKNDAWNASCQAPKGLNFHCSLPEGKDHDIGAPPILVNLPNGEKAILAGAKNGAVYSVNPATGALNWVRRLGVGGSLGGIHWGMAVDSKNVYAAVTDLFVNKLTRITGPGGIDGATSEAMKPVDNAHPGIYALDLMSGDLVWEKHIQHQYKGETYNSLFSSALSVTNDVLLAANLNGVLKALRTSDGQELWSFDTAIKVTDANGVVGNGGTVDSVGPVPAGKDVYLNSGYSTFGGTNPWQAGPGNALFVFRLP
ncbi:MAG: PQQ-binding-like beta-propeller repeat protein [Aquabacterium sp.]|nr:PQQ-binding-like beta-propeller repeat protein [Aquabacterium sp.]